MLIGNVIKYCPETISMMMNHGINSFATHIIKQNTLERAAASNDINVGMLIYEINNKTIIITLQSMDP